MTRYRASFLGETEGRPELVVLVKEVQAAGDEAAVKRARWPGRHPYSWTWRNWCWGLVVVHDFEVEVTEDGRVVRQWANADSESIYERVTCTGVVDACGAVSRFIQWRAVSAPTVAESTGGAPGSMSTNHYQVG